MALAPAGFSIREYALNMRSKELSKCWPFGDNEKKEVVEAFLPPITVPKFRWWSHELHLLQPAGGAVPGPPHPQVHDDQKSTDKISKDDDRRRCHQSQTTTMMMKKPKSSRIPKKRSIAEIFAQTIVVDCDNNSPDQKPTFPNSKIKASSSLARTLVSKLFNKAGQRQNKNKLPGKKKNRNHWDVSILCKKPCFKRLSRQKGQELVKKCKLTIGKRRPRPVTTTTIPIKSILKRRTKVVSETNLSSSGNSKSSDQLMAVAYGGQRRPSDKRVSFIDKDEVLGPRPRVDFSDSAIEQNVSFPFQDSFSSSKENSMSDETNSSNAVPSLREVGNENDGFGSYDGQDIQEDIQFPVNHDQVNMECPSIRPHRCWPDNNMNHPTENKLISDENRTIPLVSDHHVHFLHHGYLTMPLIRPTHSAIPGILAVQEERQYAQPKTTVFDSNIPRAHAFFGIHPIQAGEAGLSPMTGTLNFHHEPCMTTQKEMTNTKRPFPFWEKNAVAVSGKENHGVNGGQFFCLPLNSKGELIQINPAVTIDRNDQMNGGSNNNMVCSSSSSIPIRSTQDHFIENEKRLAAGRKFTENHLSLFPMHSNLHENQNRYLPARSDANNPGTSNSDRRNEACSLLHSNFMDMNVPFSRCGYYGTQHVNREAYHENLNPARRTMRLMGKDVAIGGNVIENREFEGSKFLNNKRGLIDHEDYHTGSVQEINNPMNQRNFLQDWAFPPHPSKCETLLYPSGFHGSDQMMERNLMTHGMECEFSHVGLNRKSNMVYKKWDSGINVNERVNNIHVFHPPCSEVFDMTPNFEATFGSQSSAFSTAHHICQSRYGNSFEHGHSLNQINAHPVKLRTFNFPFLHPDDDNRAHQPHSFHSPKSLPSWMLHANQLQRDPAPTATSKIDINGYCCPFISSDTNVLPIPSVHCIPDTPMFQPISVVVPRAQLPPTTVNTSCHGNRLKPSSFSVKESDFQKRSMKRPACDDLVDSRKRPNISSLDVMTGWMKGRFNGNPGTTAKVHVNGNRVVNSAAMAAQRDGIIMNSPTMVSPPKVECTVRSGPIKLTAGAKHILKPSQSQTQNQSSMDLNNIKPTYSTIPFSGLIS